MREKFFRYAAFMMAYYITNAIYQGFLSLYFRDVAGLSTQWISIVMASVPFVSMFTQTAWGLAGDKMKTRNTVLRILAVGAAASILLLRVSTSAWWILPVMCVFSCFYTSIQPMGDSIVLENLQNRGINFGPIRLAGCWSFAIVSFFGGRFLDSRIGATIYITAGLLALVFASTYALPATPGHQHGKEKMSIKVLFREKKLMRLLGFMTLLQMTMGYFYTYYSIYFTSFEGGTTSLLGAAYFVSAVSETAFLLLSDKLVKKPGVGKLLVIAGCVLTLRWILLATAQNVWVAFGAQVLHGWGFIVMTVSMAKYISQNVPDELKATGQMLLNVAGFGVARVVGIVLGGLIAGSMGVQGGFWVSAAISGLALILFAPGYLREKTA